MAADLDLLRQLARGLLTYQALLLTDARPAEADWRERLEMAARATSRQGALGALMRPAAAEAVAGQPAVTFGTRQALAGAAAVQRVHREWRQALRAERKGPPAAPQEGSALRQDALIWLASQLLRWLTQLPCVAPVSEYGQAYPAGGGAREFAAAFLAVWSTPEALAAAQAAVPALLEALNAALHALHEVVDSGALASLPGTSAQLAGLLPSASASQAERFAAGALLELLEVLTHFCIYIQGASDWACPGNSRAALAAAEAVLRLIPKVQQPPSLGDNDQTTCAALLDVSRRIIRALLYELEPGSLPGAPAGPHAARGTIEPTEALAVLEPAVDTALSATKLAQWILGLGPEGRERALGRDALSAGCTALSVAVLVAWQLFSHAHTAGQASSVRWALPVWARSMGISQCCLAERRCGATRCMRGSAARSAAAAQNPLLAVRRRMQALMASTMGAALPLLRAMAQQAQQATSQPAHLAEPALARLLEDLATAFFATMDTVGACVPHLAADPGAALLAISSGASELVADLLRLVPVRTSCIALSAHEHACALRCRTAQLPCY